MDNPEVMEEMALKIKAHYLNKDLQEDALMVMDVEEESAE
jgi:hypothetical protein